MSPDEVILCYNCGADLAEKESALFLPEYRKVVCDHDPRLADPETTCLDQFMRERGIQHIEHEQVAYADLVNLARRGAIKQHDISDFLQD